MKLLKSKKGMSTGSIISVVIGIVVAVIMIPVAITQITASSGNYTGTQSTLLNLVPTLLVVGLLVGAVATAGIKGL